eukprot:TRINITY_DN434_c0_g1_i2.p1 TRINITY_DN434_c0_g1~~TRINITY_DN434_c0_g1_i2.p1  ORF type:complete len:209 (-),score=4.97 TRINITY_DN434_c0_g1_i2:368-994(-)
MFGFCLCFLLLCSPQLQRHVHKLLLAETGPPFAKSVLVSIPCLFQQTGRQFLSQLHEIAANSVAFLAILWSGYHSVERESLVSWNGEGGNGQGVHGLFGITLALARFQLLQTLRNKQSQIDQNTVRTALDFKVAEQDVGLEEQKSFVDNVPFCNTHKTGKYQTVSKPGDHKKKFAGKKNFGRKKNKRGKILVRRLVGWITPTLQRPDA